MGNQFKAILLSFAIHTMVFIGIAGLSSSIMVNKRIIIDFGIESSTALKGDKKTSLEKYVKARYIPKTEKPEINKDKHLDKFPTLSSPTSDVPVPMDEKPETVESQDLLNETTSSMGGGGDEETVFSRENYLRANFSYIRDAIHKKATYPLIARQMGWEGKVEVSFIICADGSVKEIKVVRSSGIEVLDKGAEESIKKASPFPKPPVEANVIIPIHYRLN